LRLPAEERLPDCCGFLCGPLPDPIHLFLVQQLSEALLDLEVALFGLLFLEGTELGS
jgi:hypothetical protein